jgi:holo-[acyl-carrier protein] synthase
MILGIGNDTVDIRRIEQTIARHGDRFIDRVFTPLERAKAERRTERIRASTYAKRFAAKEAASKALGTGFRAGVFFRDLGVVNLTSGQPTLHLTGGAAARLARLVPAGHVARIDLTMTDEYPYASAVVIISAVPLSASSDAA